MGTYISRSTGEEKDTTTMPLPYLTNALAKAQANFDQENIDVLQQELTDRAGGADTSVAEGENGLGTQDDNGGLVTTDEGGVADDGNYQG